jgi:hypothetical protein
LVTEFVCSYDSGKQLKPFSAIPQEDERVEEEGSLLLEYTTPFDPEER